MRLREMSVTTLVAVGVTLIVVALGVTFLSERSPIRADDPAPTATATSTQATTTKENSFDPSAIPTIVPPPCVEEVRRKYAPHPDISFGYTATQCNLRDSDGNYISEAQAFLMMAEWEREKAQAAQNAAATEETVDPALSARSITLRDGSVVNLPDDVRIVEVERYVKILCVVGEYCPKPPLYLLERGNSTMWIWMDSHGVGYGSSGRIDPDDFSFLPRIELY